MKSSHRKVMLSLNSHIMLKQKKNEGWQSFLPLNTSIQVQHKLISKIFVNKK